MRLVKRAVVSKGPLVKVLQTSFTFTKEINENKLQYSAALADFHAGPQSWSNWN